MCKQEFLAGLRKGLNGLPANDIEERLTFYSEMIDDYMEEGLTESEAVSAVGSVDKIVAQIMSEIPHPKTVNPKQKSKRRLNTGEILLLVLGSPLWIPLTISAFAIIFSLYISLWAVIISLWSVFASLVGCSIGGMLACVKFVMFGNTAVGVAMLAAGIVCAGLSIFVFCGCAAVTKGVCKITKNTIIWILNCFREKRDVQ